MLHVGGGLVVDVDAENESGSSFDGGALGKDGRELQLGRVDEEVLLAGDVDNAVESDFDAAIGGPMDSLVLDGLVEAWRGAAETVGHVVVGAGHLLEALFTEGEAHRLPARLPNGPRPG